ncbi:hypothetical protein F5141DRAFT_1150186 [Pisolithus sp. B1]|nr:hypothetical protein F5141DRAFT_1150186 [Pisolithus sp. B1]
MMRLHAKVTFSSYALFAYVFGRNLANDDCQIWGPNHGPVLARVAQDYNVLSQVITQDQLHLASPNLAAIVDGRPECLRRDEGVNTTPRPVLPAHGLHVSSRHQRQPPHALRF